MKYLPIIAIIFLETYCKEKPPQIIKGESKKESEQLYHHFQAVARSGLRIRELPNLTSKKVALVPYRKSGQILELGKKVEKIDGRNGYWAKVRYKEFEGWIFTGYALLSGNPPADSDENDIFSSDYKVETMRREYETEDLSETRKRSLGILGGVEIFEIKNSEQIELKLPGNIFFKKADGFEAFQTGGYERVEKKSFPRSNSLITGSIDCIACCASYEPASRMYLIGKDSIKVLDLRFIDQKARCRKSDEDDEDTLFEIRNQWSEDGSTLYNFTRQPHCDIYDKDGFLTNSEPEKKRFTVVHFTDDDIKIENYRNSDIPEKYIQIWNSGELKKMIIKP